MRVKSLKRTAAALLMYFCVWAVGCSSEQQTYTTARFLPAEPSKRVALSNGDAQAGQRAGAVGELGGSISIKSVPVRSDDNLGEFGVSQVFSASKVTHHETTFEFASSRVTSKVTMTREESPQSLTITQPYRESVVDVFEQGGSGQTIVESASQASAQGALDILVVVDDSGSMAGEQKNLSTKLEPLLSEISQSDWRIGVITTSKKQTGLRALISRGDTNAAELFRQAVTPGTAGDGTERGVYQAVQGLKAPNFLRTGSSVAILIVSDEDNCSTGEASKSCSKEESRFASYLTNYLTNTAQRELKTQARIYGLTWMPGTECKGGYNQGHVYAEAIELSGGRGGSICDTDYTATLKEISLNVKSILQNSWSLKHTPDAGTLQVFLDDVEISSGFQLSGRFVKFTQAPAANVKIKFVYKVGAQPLLTSFRLSQIPRQDSLSVQVNGVDLQDAYSLSAVDPRVLTLNNTAPEFAQIKVVYKKEEVLPQSFKIDDNIKPNSTLVTVNGVEVPHVFYPQSQTISLTEPTDEGAVVKIDYSRLGAAVLDYPFTAPGLDVKNVSAMDLNSMADVKVVVDSAMGIVSFQPIDFVDGREILVRFDDALVLDGFYTLPHVPLSDSVRIFDAFKNSICELAGSVTVQSNRLSLNCGIGAGAEFLVTYKALTDVKTRFDFSDLTAEQCDLMKWSVFINGVEDNASLSRVGCSFNALKPLPHGGIVLISNLAKGG